MDAETIRQIFMLCDGQLYLTRFDFGVAERDRLIACVEDNIHEDKIDYENAAKDFNDFNEGVEK